MSYSLDSLKGVDRGDFKGELLYGPCSLLVGV